MPLPHRLYAVVARSTQPVAKKQKVLAICREKLLELETKKAIDRANAMLDRLEQRIADYDAEIRRVCEQYLEPLQRRRACVQYRLNRLGDEILARLSEANLERADGFSRQFQAVSCPRAVQVDNLSLIPDEYIRHKPEADKVAIKRALERHQDLIIPGVHLTQKLRLARK